MKIVPMKVELLRVDGTDLDVCQAARVSFDKSSEWDSEVEFIGGEVVRKLTDRDAGLIRYLSKHDHWTPMAHVGAQFRVKAPIFVARQLVKHQIGLCLAGGTEITFVKRVRGVSNGTYTRTLSEIARMWSGEVKYQGGAKGRRNVTGSHIRVFNESNQRFETSHICNVIDSGVREVLLIKTSCGNSLKATSDHKMLTHNGWKRVGDLLPGDLLVRSDVGDAFSQTPSSRGDSPDVIARRAARSTLPTHCFYCGTNSATLQVDHRVPVKNGGGHELDNLQRLCSDCHKAKTKAEREKNSTTLVPKTVQVVDVREAGTEQCYDISVERIHNFMANGFVAHNCWNEVSRRYVDSEPEVFFPDVWRARAANVKQGSADEPAAHQHALQGLARLHLERSLDLYDNMLRNGVAPEQARMVLPLNVMTEWVWTGSLVAWARVCKLRLDPHAQVEVQEVAKHFDQLLRPAFPVSWPALMGEPA